MNTQYQTVEQLRALLAALVAIPSVTGSSAEEAIAVDIYERLRGLPYFRTHPEHLGLHAVDDDRTNRQLVIGLVKAKRPTRATVIVIAHFDVDDVDAYGPYADLAFDAETWTDLLRSGRVPLPDHARADLDRGNWWFGRGTMDMKAGLALNISMVEWASLLDDGGNLLFLAVPDEERHSDGMTAAAPLLVELAQKHQLDYHLCIDTEPSLVDSDADPTCAVYTGTGGKVLVGALGIGRETHVEAPFEGLSGVRMMAALIRRLEGNAALADVVGDEAAAPPACLWSRDLKSSYSVSIPYKAAAYFNLLFLQRSPLALLDAVRREAQQAMLDLAGEIAANMRANGINMDLAEVGAATNVADQITVRLFHEVFAHAKMLAPEQVHVAMERLVADVERGTDVREATLAYVDAVAALCRDWQPMVVLFLAPPFYPAVSSAEDPCVQSVVTALRGRAEQVGLTLRERRYFTGLCDLSYVGTGTMGRDGPLLAANMPLWGHGYSLPLDALAQLEIPVLNLGPFGKDAHKWTERLDLTYTFDVLPDLLKTAIRSAWQARA
ncbi:MAG: M20/M25/M40 family metallo-hydrolase [Alicyclobacillus sp.]|nr:M20/M25/M40 family metallo-hydrolase [Alicyclobacillus sp.]